MNKSTEPKWFLQLNGQVQGPFNQESLQFALQKLGHENSNALIWKRGLAEWVKANKLNSNDLKPIPAKSTLPNPANIESEVTPDGDLFEKTFTQSFTDGVFYRVQINFIDQPLMSKTELMTLIAKQQDVSKVSIQDPKSKEWKEVYAFPDIVEKLGLSRRKQARVPILAQFAGKNSKNEEVSYRVLTISQGGIGITESFDLNIGDEIDGLISSPHFFQSIHIKAEVVYAGQDGYVGLKFSNIPDEANTAIVDYIKKFGKS